MPLPVGFVCSSNFLLGLLAGSSSSMTSLLDDSAFFSFFDIFPLLGEAEDEAPLEALLVGVSLVEEVLFLFFFFLSGVGAAIGFATAAVSAILCSISIPLCCVFVFCFLFWFGFKPFPISFVFEMC